MHVGQVWVFPEINGRCKRSLIRPAWSVKGMETHRFTSAEGAVRLDSCECFLKEKDKDRKCKRDRHKTLMV